MNNQHNLLKTILVLLALSLNFNKAISQTKKQQKLEERRLELRNEIKKINDLLFKNKSKAKSQTAVIEDVNYKISVRKNLIKITNQQANLLTREINTNQKNISKLKEDLSHLKTNYAKLLEKAYKNKSKLSRIMFLLSSENFKQAYKRLEYINQYQNYQKEQGESIKTKTEALKTINHTLAKKKETKNKLVLENRVVQRELEKELLLQEDLMKSINKDLSKFSTQIRNKQKEATKIDLQIDKIIREAIAKSNEKAGSKSNKSSSFALTTESKALANSFLASKGKLPWPVERGIVKVRYGKQKSAFDPSIIINSNGVRIATEKGAKVRSVFKGEVLSIGQIKRGRLYVVVRHGNYFSSYKNLSKIVVKKGDKISTKQIIGEVFTNKTTGQTQLGFSVFKENKTQNPSEWIFKL